MDGFTFDGSREGIVQLTTLRALLVIQPDMIDAWMALKSLICDARDIRALASVREEIDEATARLLAGAERIRTLAHRFRNM